ncbi:3-keto-5-aminohexanoate cleavage enzyme [Desulfosarcina ovata subsp. sediminis]|uniref:3-keto-5-aminohexanoate cleavage enzyme n=2 Tax=Desulfosarcina ovata TaxID=83564 RepID=A0A5K8A0M8_9BACT|nr:3-keto-5-aminohexanoate cleavage enzyme [Desulfosarcina ovata subsp. sediminis]
MKKLIVTVAPTSNFHGKDANPALPFSPEEVADSVFGCWNEGASIAHIHGRDKNGLPTNDTAFFQETDRLIRGKGCDIILQHSMAPANPYLLGQKEGDIDDGIRTTYTDPPPEMASIEVAPSNIIVDGTVYNMLWDRLWAERTAKYLLEKGIKPEVELYNNSDVDDLEYLIERGVLAKPYYVSFVMGMHRVNNQASRYSPKHMMHLVDILPSDTIFSVLGIGNTEFEATTLSILLGGNVRVGFEDNIFIEKGKLAESNGQSVAKIVRIARELGREIASPSETRQMLGIPPLKI